jgi:type IV pilus assembly protein PilM
LPEERVYFFETDIDKDVSEAELRSQLEFKLEENVPIPSRDSYFDYQLFQNEHSVSGMSAVVAVAPKAIIDSYHEACRIAGIVPLSFEVELQAIARAVTVKGDKATRLIVDFGRSRTGIGIVHQGLLVYTSTVDIGGDSLSAALKRSVGEKTEDELTLIKIEQGLIPGTGGNSPAESLLPLVSSVKDEIIQRLQYWNDKDSGSSRPIEQIILVGGSSNLRGLTAYFEETLGINTVLADVWQNVFTTKKGVPEIDKRHSYGYATAIGLGLTSFL